MAGLDLTGVQRALEQWLIDELEVVRGDQNQAGAELDPDTGKLTLVDAEPVYDGLGAVQPLSSFIAQADPDVTAIVAATGARYRGLIPIDETFPARVGDTLRVKAIHSPSASPGLAGTAYEIVHPGDESSFAVVRICYLKPIGVGVAPTPDPDPEP